MTKLVVICDFCEKPLPIEGENNVTLHRTKTIDTRDLFPHLCEGCATKLDLAVKHCKKRTATKSELAAKMARINAERRAYSNTKG